MEDFSTSSELIQLVKKEDPEAWERFVDEYGTLVYRWARQRGLTESDSADLTQEVFSKLLVHIVKFDSDRPNASFRGWLKRVSTNTIVDFQRKQGRTIQARGGSTAKVIIEETIAADDELLDHRVPDLVTEVRAVMKIVESERSSRDWKLFLSLLESDDTKEVAEEFGVSAENVRQIKSRMLKRIRELYEQNRGS